MIDTNKYKPQIRRYLQLKGIEIITTEHPNLCRCPNPTHTDNKPSAVIYDETSQYDPGVWCPICQKKWDIFEFAGDICGYTDFKDKRDEVLRVLGENVKEQKPKPKKINTEVRKLVPLSIEDARKIFDIKMLTSRGKKYKWGTKVTGAWPYKNENGMVEIIDIRYEGGTKKKNVVSFHYNGKFVTSKNSPIKIYNRDLIEKYPNHIILINEGAKKTKIAEPLIEYGILPIAWSGGHGKVLRADWTCIHGRDVYFFPDDDRHINKITGKVKDYKDQPGMNAAMLFCDRNKKFLNKFKIVPYYIPSREIKPDGADIEEMFKLLTPDKIAEYIKESKSFEIEKNETIKKETDVESDNLPFRILGTAENGKSYFIDRHGRLYDMKLDTISQKKLSILAPLTFWKNYDGVMRQRISKDEWLEIMDDIIELAGRRDFDTDNIRGRGAWREKDGRICFHTGKKTIGEYDKKRVFLRKPEIDIGIGSKPVGLDIIEKMKETAFMLSFEKHTDAMRLLAWSVIAPFSGAFPWRVQILLTGPSSSGKSSIESNIVKPLAIPARFNGGKTSAAGYIQDRKKDCGAVVIEEMDPDTEKKKIYREDLLSIMRQSTSDDTPKSAMGTSDQGGQTYLTRDMFLFIAISSEIESEADDNRLTRVSTKKPAKKSMSWGEILKHITKWYTPENCAALRGMVWGKLKYIISLADKISIIIQDYTKRDHRFAISEGTLMAAYLTIWKQKENLTTDELKEFILGIYEISKPGDTRNKSEEMLELILEEKIRVFAEKQSEYSVSEIIQILHSGKIESGKQEDYGKMREITGVERIEFRRAIENNGIFIQDNLLGIANNHKEVRRILNVSRGYSTMLVRHSKCVEKNKNINRNGMQKRCTMFDIFGVIPF